MLATGQKFVAENDMAIGLYFDFGPMLYKQTTYTVTKFCVQQKAAKAIHQNLGTSPSEMSKDAVLTLSLVCGIATDVAAPAASPDSEISFESNLNDLVTGQDAFVFHVCPIRILKRMLSNTTIARDHEKSVFPVVVPPVTCQVFPRIQITILHKWPLRTAHQSNKNFVCGNFTIELENDHIFEFATEVHEETTNENDYVLEENYIMIYVKMNNGKTISVKCEGKQTAAIISDEVEHKGKVMIEKKTIEANNIDAEATLEMSLRLLGGMEKNEQMDTHETRRQREKKRKLEEGKEGKMTKPNDDTVYLRRDIMEKHSKDQTKKMESYSRKADEKNGKLLKKGSQKMENFSRKADEMMEKVSADPEYSWKSNQRDELIHHENERRRG